MAASRHGPSPASYWNWSPRAAIGEVAARVTGPSFTIRLSDDATHGSIAATAVSVMRRIVPSSSSDDRIEAAISENASTSATLGWALVRWSLAIRFASLPSGRRSYRWPRAAHE